MRFYLKFRILWCYLFMLLWLGTLLIYLSYWRMDADKSDLLGPLPQGNGHSNTGPLPFDNKRRHRKSQIHCNPPERIHLGHEGQIPGNYKFLGTIILFRHGDRGPLNAIQNLSSINCGIQGTSTTLYNKYSTSLLNISKTDSYINFVGSFMKHPLLPPPSRCSLGNLTPVGVMQHLHLGAVLKSLYIDKFSLLSFPWNAEDIVIQCTKYRRTFQSTLAFLYGFLPMFDLSNIHIKEANGVDLCGNYCKCDKIIFYEVKHEKEKSEYRMSHPSILDLVTTLNPIIKASTSFEDISTPSAMRDALLAYSCHGSKFPCLAKRCINFEDLGKLISFEEWEARQRATTNQIKGSKLRMHGLLQEMQQTIQSMLNHGKPKVSIYSAHDRTINFFLTSLGIPHFQPPYYASRVILEVYQNNTNGAQNSGANSHLFRLIYNGKDLTKLLPFCHPTVVKQVTSGNVKMSNMLLCKVSEFERYLDPKIYFKEFNSTSFESACMN